MAVQLRWITDELESLRQQGLYINLRTISSPQGPWIVADGRSVLNFCTNNYLGLANHPYLKQAAKKAIDELGVGPEGTRTNAGTLALHVELEKRLAHFKAAEAAVLFQSGYNANVGTVAALAGEGDVIFSDRLNHASIIDGARLSRAKVVPYEHNDPQALEDVVRKEPLYRRGFLVTDGVFSMDGDIAPLPALADVASRHDLLLIVDDAHGEGVLGHGGRGVVDHFGLHGKVDVEVGTLSKAFGVVGGYTAARKEIVEWLKQRGRPFVFSSALTPADTAACIAAVDILETSTDLVDRLWENTRYFRGEMRRLSGWTEFC